MRRVRYSVAMSLDASAAVDAERLKTRAMGSSVNEERREQARLSAGRQGCQA